MTHLKSRVFYFSQVQLVTAQVSLPAVGEAVTREEARHRQPAFLAPKPRHPDTALEWTLWTGVGKVFRFCVLTRVSFAGMLIYNRLSKPEGFLCLLLQNLSLSVFEPSVLLMTLGVCLSPTAGQTDLEFTQDKRHAFSIISLRVKLYNII